MVFICDVEGCGKNFSCKKTLKEHERTHTGERPYSCAICQTTFAQYSSLQKHQRVHDKKKPYRCKYENCQQAFSQISNLIRHERIHTGEKPYACEICKKKFASGSNLKQHMQVHNNDETRIQFKCFVSECEKGYLYLSSLKKHIQVSHPIEYETKIKTNKVDLNSCKEIVSNPENHQYHDDEEENSQPLPIQMISTQKDSILSKRKAIEEKSKKISQEQQQLISEQNLQVQSMQLSSVPIELNNNDQNLEQGYAPQTKRVKITHIPHQKETEQAAFSQTQMDINNNNAQYFQVLPSFADQKKDSVDYINQFIIKPSDANYLSQHQQSQQQQQQQQQQTQQQLSVNHFFKPQLSGQFSGYSPYQMQSYQDSLTQQQNQQSYQSDIIPIATHQQQYQQVYKPQQIQQFIPVNPLSLLPQQQNIPQIQIQHQQQVQHYQQSHQQKQLQQNQQVQPPQSAPFQVQTQQTPQNQQQAQFNQIKGQNNIMLHSEILNDLKQLQEKLQQEAPQALQSVQLMMNKYQTSQNIDQINSQSQISQSFNAQQIDQQIQDSQESLNVFDPFRSQLRVKEKETIDYQENNSQNIKISLSQNKKKNTHDEQAINGQESQLLNQPLNPLIFSNLTIKEEMAGVQQFTNDSNQQFTEPIINTMQSLKNNDTQSSNTSSQKKYLFQSKPLKNHQMIKQESQTKEEIDSLNENESLKFNPSRHNSFVIPQPLPNIQDIYTESSQTEKLLLPVNQNINQTQLKQEIQNGLFRQNHQQCSQTQEPNISSKISLPSLQHLSRLTNVSPGRLVGSLQKSKKREEGSCSSKSSCCGGSCSGSGNKTEEKLSDPMITEENNNQTDDGSQFFRGYNNQDYDESMMVDQMNHQYGANQNNQEGDFKAPFPVLNKVQSSLLNKNKDQTIKFFSKLPCIKTCMSKITFAGDSKKSKSPSKQIGFERIEDDFDDQSQAQISTAACKHICDAQKLCPELLPTNCDDYFEKKCSCTEYCKKTLKFIQKFVKDENQVAEIEDLCTIRDQLTVMADDHSKGHKSACQDKCGGNQSN